MFYAKKFQVFKKKRAVIPLGITIIALLLVIMLLSACQPQTTTVVETVLVEGTPQVVEVSVQVEDEMPIELEIDHNYESSENLNASSLPVQRLIIREGTIEIQTEDTRYTRDQIYLIVDSYYLQGAYIVNSHENGTSDPAQPSITMTIRIPVQDFNTIMADIASLAVEVTNRSENAQDVTEEFVDVQARIESMEAARDRLISIMESADNTEDLLDTERLITQREAEIEALKARLNFLSQSAQLSKITIRISHFIPDVTPTPTPTPTPVDNSWKISQTFDEASEDLVLNTQDFTYGLIRFVVTTLPNLLIWGLILWLAYNLIRRQVDKWRVKPPTTS